MFGFLFYATASIFGLPPLIWLAHQVPGRTGWWIGGICSALPPLVLIYLSWAAHGAWQQNCHDSGCSGMADGTPGLTTVAAVMTTWTWCASWGTRIIGGSRETILDRWIRTVIGTMIAVGPWALIMILLLR